MSNRASISNIVKLSIPIFFANLVIPLVAIVDTGLMGNLDNASYLTATSIATSVFSLIFWSFGFLRMGTVDGRRSHSKHPGGSPLYPFPGSFHRRLHHGRNQVMSVTALC